MNGLKKLDNLPKWMVGHLGHCGTWLTIFIVIFMLIMLFIFGCTVSILWTAAIFFASLVALALAGVIYVLFVVL